MSSELLSLYKSLKTVVEKTETLQNSNHNVDAILGYAQVDKIIQKIYKLEEKERIKNSLLDKKCNYEKKKTLLINELSTQELDALFIRGNKIISMADALSAQNSVDEALELYIQSLDALELYLQGISLAENQANSTKQAKKLMLKVLQKAESLKSRAGNECIIEPTSKEEAKAVNKKENAVPPNSKITKEEIRVIKESSVVNGLVFLPWTDNDRIVETKTQTLYNDPNGKVKLSIYQQEKCKQWKRLSKYYSGVCTTPQIVDCESIIQKVVTDCSFVASLCVCANYETMFGKKIVRNLLFPQDDDEEPILSRSGKYVAKLFINGFWRKVEIDDLFPIAADGTLMCTFSTENILWIPLLEKAFLKVMGGYGFPGSNSTIDLHNLTSWIPEQVFISELQVKKTENWARIHYGLNNGDAVVTIATGELTKGKQIESGLVPSHAYAVLKTVELENGTRLLFIKNPWGQGSWKGKYSFYDNTVWTENLKHKLGYDPEKERKSDRGLFWMDYESVCENFETFHINWNPSIFRHTDVIYFTWPKEHGPESDYYDISQNPQFVLETVRNSKIWLLLSRDIVETEEMSSDYIALHVYDTEATKNFKELDRTQQHVLTDPAYRLLDNFSISNEEDRNSSAVRIGEYVNTQLLLVRLESNLADTVVVSPKNTGSQSLQAKNSSNGKSVDQKKLYNLVVSQKLKTKKLNFSLRAYSDSYIKLHKLEDFPFSKTIKSQWVNNLSGGNPQSSDYLNNPQFKLTIENGDTDESINGIVLLESSYSYPVHIRVFRSGHLVSIISSVNIVAQSETYKQKFTSVHLNNLKDNAYTVLVSTYEPFLFGPFTLTVRLNRDFQISSIPREGAGMRHKILSGSWIPDVNSFGPISNPKYFSNPRFGLNFEFPTYIIARLQCNNRSKIAKKSESINLPYINLSMFRNDGKDELVLSSGPYTNSPQGALIKKTLVKPHPTGYYLVPSTWSSELSANFSIHVYYDTDVTFE